MADQPRRPRTLNDARTEAEAAFKRTTTKVAEAPPKPTAASGREGTGLAAHRSGCAGVFPGGRPRLGRTASTRRCESRGEIVRRAKMRSPGRPLCRISGCVSCPSGR